MSIYKDCDIRGVYPGEIDEADARAVGRALATLHPGARMAVGGDVRVSTPALKSAFIDGLVDSGAQVTDIGTVPTPALYWALANLDVQGGATVTASHNPPKYNGIKFMFDGMPVNRQIMDAVQSTVESGAFAGQRGSVEARDILPAYMDGLAARFHISRPLKVVVDAGNGAMGPVAPQVLQRCGCEVVELFCEPDGRFPNRDPNPAEYSHLSAVCERTAAEGADFGVAFDGDGDRAVFVDETGHAVMNEKSLVLFICHLLKDRPTPVVYDQKSSSVIRRAVLAMGGTPVPERSGHAFIKRRFLEVGAAIAGEVSGHFFFGELGYDDGLFAALTMAELLAGSDRSLSALAGEIACPPITPDLRVHCPYDQQQNWLDRVEALAEGRECAVSHMDGVRLEFADGWLLMRKSVTAEQITLRAEAETPERLRALLELVASALPGEAAREILR
ncbi:MAG: phosphomannomutase/phosphoglucomutase [Clostridia bacterium]|nr:phosphomannomutase/phosphoglucomutase [Clostridia bacterium]